MSELMGEDRLSSREMISTPFWKKHILTMMIFIAVLGGISVLVLFSYEKRTKSTIPSKIKIIQARTGPTKLKPENPGGMIIPDQDKEIFSRLNPLVVNEKVEYLLPTPEVVISKQGNVIHQSDGRFQRNQSLKTIPRSSVLTKPKITKEVLKTPDKSIVNSSVVRKIYRVQIASLRSENAVKQFWLEIKNKYPKMFRNLKFFFVRVEIEGKGTYFRLQLGPLKTSKLARELCQRIRTIKAGCFIVKSS